MRAVVILDGRAPHAVLLELFTAHGAGTPDPRLTPWPVSREVAARPRRDGLAVARRPPPAGDGAAGRGRWCCSGRTGPGFWERFRPRPEARDGRRRPAQPLVGAGDRRARGRSSAPRRSSRSAGRRGSRSPPGRGRAARPGTSPVGLLVHARLGLFVSYRGALAFAARLALPPPAARPCDRLRPALPRRLPGRGAGPATATMCRLPRLARHRPRARLPRSRLRGAAGLPGRRADLRPEAQSAFHMAAFHGRQSPCDG